MEGVVFKINWQRGMVAIKTETDDFSIIELLGDGTIEEGDEVYWEDHTTLGGDVIKNVTQCCELDVYFQNHYVTANNLKQQLLF